MPDTTVDQSQRLRTIVLCFMVAVLEGYDIQAIGVARTSLYSNLVPVAAMTFAALWLGEPITLIKAAGTTAVLTGLFLTRLGNRPIAVPVEE